LATGTAWGSGREMQDRGDAWREVGEREGGGNDHAIGEETCATERYV